ncbi:MAG: hypothetical protein HQM12_04075, partial [SAR324 cluster bacterium]|nr:hypothetical protein [SAR324 cluster bacterium]
MSRTTDDPTKKNILFIGHDPAGGAGKVQLTILKKLKTLGFNIRIFYLHERGEYVDEAHQLGACFGIKYQSSILQDKISILYQLLKISDSVSLVVGMIDGSPSYLAAIISLLRKSPSLCWLHG